jgi:hypothetical protein
VPAGECHRHATDAAFPRSVVGICTRVLRLRAGMPSLSLYHRMSTLPALSPIQKHHSKNDGQTTIRFSHSSIHKNSTMGMSVKCVQLPSSAGTFGGSQALEQTYFVSCNVRKGCWASDPGKRGLFLPIRFRHRQHRSELDDRGLRVNLGYVLSAWITRTIEF